MGVTAKVLITGFCLALAGAAAPQDVKPAASDPPGQNGLIGPDDRRPVELFDPGPGWAGWQDAASAVVAITCEGRPLATGALVGHSNLVLTAAHFVYYDDGTPRSRVGCQATSVMGAGSARVGDTIKTGGFAVPDVLAQYFVAEITVTDWAWLQLEAPISGARPLGFATADAAAGTEAMLVTGPTDSNPHDGAMAQLCTMAAAPTRTTGVNALGFAEEVATAPDVAALVWSSDCDIGRGGSGAPILVRDGAGQLVVAGVVTDSNRNTATGCPRMLPDDCYSAGPRAAAIGR